MAVAASRFDLSARAAELHRQITGWEDEARRCERRKEELEREVREAQARLEITVQQQQRYEQKIAEAHDELERIGELTGVADPPKPTKPPERQTTEASVRAAILRFGEGTLAEVAAYLRVKPRQVEALMAAEEAAGVIRFTGRSVARSPQWEYVPPTDAGAAFRLQQDQREHEQLPVALEVAGVGEGYLPSLPKDVRKEARKAMRDGWALSVKGSGHFQLTRGTDVVTFSGTPQNPSAEARKVRSLVNRSAAHRVQRGAPVPGTGQPIGSSGKPGLDKARANAGKTVRRKGRRGM